MLSASEFLALDLPKVVIYHKNCPDGFGAAYTAWLAMGNNAAYHPMLYGDKLPSLPARAAILIADFSLPREQMIELAKIHQLVVLDHHKTAKDNCAGLDFAQFDMARCGTMQVKDYLQVLYPLYQTTGGLGDMEKYTLADYIQDRDLWTWKLPNSQEISAALASYPFDFAQWYFLELDGLRMEGSAILRYQKLLVERICKLARHCEVLGKKGIGVNTPILQSEVGHQLLQDHPRAAFAAMYHWNRELEENYSLRSRSVEECDVSAMAGKFPGGGGHPCAAGFKITPELAQAVAASVTK